MVFVGGLVGIKIERQPNGKYTIFDWHKIRIFEIDLDPSELFEYLYKIAKEICPYRVPEAMAGFKEEFERIGKGVEPGRSWKDAMRLSILGPGRCLESNGLKVREAVGLGLMTESELEEIHREREEDQVPLLERKTIPLSVFRRPVEDLEPSVRLGVLLSRLGIETVGDLLGYSEEELRERHKFGRRGVEELRSVLWDFRIVLRKNGEST